MSVLELVEDLLAVLRALEANYVLLAARLEHLERKITTEIRELTAERNHLLAQLAHQDDDD